MRLLFLAKRFYTNRDLLNDRFGRIFHLPLGLKRAGHDVQVLALDYRSSGSEELTVEGMSFLTVPATPSHLPGLWPRLRRFAEDFDPEIVVGSADTPIGWLAGRLAARTGSRFVFDVYDNYGSFASGRLPGVRRLFTRLLRSADLVVGASEALVGLAQNAGGKAVRIPNGIDPAVFHPGDRSAARDHLGITPMRPVIGYIGSIEPERGIEQLLEATWLLRNDYPDLKLLVAGTDKLGIDWKENGVDYRGVLPQSEVPRLIWACDVVVLPYLDNSWGGYTYPNKLAEYAACGVPIVATRTSEFAAAMRGAEQGLCDPGSAESLAAAVRRQLDDPRLIPIGTVATWESLADELAAHLVRII